MQLFLDGPLTLCYLAILEMTWSESNDMSIKSYIPR